MSMGWRTPVSSYACSKLFERKLRYLHPPVGIGGVKSSRSNSGAFLNTCQANNPFLQSYLCKLISVTARSYSGPTSTKSNICDIVPQYTTSKCHACNPCNKTHWQRIVVLLRRPLISDEINPAFRLHQLEKSRGKQTGNFSRGAVNNQSANNSITHSNRSCFSDRTTRPDSLSQGNLIVSRRIHETRWELSAVHDAQALRMQSTTRCTKMHPRH